VQSGRACGLFGRMRLLAISGKRFSGKDTFAAMLVEHARKRGVVLPTYAFAAESKRLFVAQEAARGVEVDLQRLMVERAYKEEWRPKLTAFTVESIAKDPQVFCRAVADRIAAAKVPALITDLRLKLEIEHLKPRFELWIARVLRPDPLRTSSGWRYDAPADTHHTETELDDEKLWTHVVRNDGSLEELDRKAADLLNAYLS